MKQASRARRQLFVMLIAAGMIDCVEETTEGSNANRAGMAERRI